MELTGKLLIAMPGLSDPHFGHAVILLCLHSETGSMGILLNKENPDFRFPALLQHVGLTNHPEIPNRHVLLGGPVETNRGFVIHSTDYRSKDTHLIIHERYALTGTPDILTELSKNQGPDNFVAALGYAGWAAGQLEEELTGNTWLVGEPDDRIIYGDEFDQKWSLALRTNGIDPQFLASEGGHA